MATSGGLEFSISGSNFGFNLGEDQPPDAAIMTHLALNNKAENQFDCAYTKWISTTQVIIAFEEAAWLHVPVACMNTYACMCAHV